MLMTLQDWLAYINQLHDKQIDLGLVRVKEVASKLGLASPDKPVIVVAGTNGKGSTVAVLESIYVATGLKTGAFTSPFLYQFNEIIRINGQPVENVDICEAFEKIEAARGDISLTPFEFNTLAALIIFKKIAVEVYILEIGLGGRLDAVNLVDSDVSIITSISYDHQDRLGHTLDEIGFEKAGVFRAHQQAVFGEKSPPQRVLKVAQALNVDLHLPGYQYDTRVSAHAWDWFCDQISYKGLPLPKLAITNASNALMVVQLMQKKLPVTQAHITEGMLTAQLPGRLQVIQKPILTVLDVAHNPASVKWLAEKVRSLKPQGKRRAVFCMLQDKNLIDSILCIKDDIDEWFIAPVDNLRSFTTEQMAARMQTLQIHPFTFPDIKTAYQAALAKSYPQDCLVVFGSFYTVLACGAGDTPSV